MLDHVPAGRTRSPPKSCLENEENEQRDGERHQAEQLGKREAEEQAALLAVRGRGVAERAVEKLAEHETNADGGGTRADRGKTGADKFCGSDVHNRTPLNNPWVNED